MIKNSTLAVIENLMERYSDLKVCKDDLIKAVNFICECYRAKHKLFVCGNGGSAADSEHIVGELMKSFLLPRNLPVEIYERMQAICPSEADYFMKNLQGTLPALSFVNKIGFNTAFSNDQAPDLVFAQQILGLGNESDVVLGISTSGNSKNVIYAVQMAKVKQMKTIVLTGKMGGRLRNLADICICVPSKETYRIQEYHLSICHMFCMAAEQEFFGEES